MDPMHEFIETCAWVVLPIVTVGLLATLLVLNAVPGLERAAIGLWDALAAVLADPLPACPQCGASAKPLGQTAAERWLYCACGHAWRIPADLDRAVAGSSAFEIQRAGAGAGTESM
ncbi:MAG: hypothetical protein AB7J63_09860 [Vicinamibacterales bacterium]